MRDWRSSEPERRDLEHSADKLCATSAREWATGSDPFQGSARGGSPLDLNCESTFLTARCADLRRHGGLSGVRVLPSSARQDTRLRTQNMRWPELSIKKKMSESRRDPRVDFQTKLLLVYARFNSWHEPPATSLPEHTRESALARANTSIFKMSSDIGGEGVCYRGEEKASSHLVCRLGSRELSRLEQHG